MTTPQDLNTTPPPAPPPARPTRREGGFFTRFLAALLVILITTIIAVSATAAGLLWAGYGIGTPRDLAAAQARVATLEAINGELVSRADVMATEVSDIARRASDDREVLGEVRAAVDEMSALRAEIRDQLTSAVSQNATLVADARASRDQVAAFATAEASRVALLQELDRRSLRIERFLQRLSDIAGDAALDIGNPTPAATGAPDETPTSAPTATQTATATPAEDSAETPEPSPTARGGIIGTATPTATP